jgi:hypothetical protein
MSSGVFAASFSTRLRASSANQVDPALFAAASILAAKISSTALK